MKKKKLQLEELKVKSFITVVNKEEQRTTKGGYVHKQRLASNHIAVGHVDGGNWTSEKTRATDSDNVLANLIGGLNTGD